MKKTVIDKRADGINKVRKQNSDGAKKIGDRMIENYKNAQKPAKKGRK